VDIKGWVNYWRAQLFPSEPLNAGDLIAHYLTIAIFLLFVALILGVIGAPIVLVALYIFDKGDYLIFGIPILLGLVGVAALIVASLSAVYGNHLRLRHEGMPRLWAIVVQAMLLISGGMLGALSAKDQGFAGTFALTVVLQIAMLFFIPKNFFSKAIAQVDQSVE
jgi:hypothetical protein